MNANKKTRRSRSSTSPIPEKKINRIYRTGVARSGQAWTAYKTQHGIVTGIARSSAKKAAFLRQLQKSGNAPKWMNQWLSKGKVPPGFEVDHIKPLSIGGKDIPSNMRLLDKAFHDMHHSPGFYRPWE